MMWDFWDVIFCINLDRRTDRWSECQEEFKKVGLKKVERFPAIEEKGGRCVLSHLELLRRAHKENLRALILEDDVQFHLPGVNHIGNATKLLDTLEWDAFFLGSRTSYFLEVQKYIVRMASVGQTHAYGYHPSFLSRAIEFAENAQHQNIDQIGIFTDGKAYKIYCVNPIAAVQRKSYSELHRCVVDYSQTALDEFYEALRRHP
jgi:GR25 family glycosyltransferase involved in LPS biosynthesis